jgi:hypothetical protein
MSADDTAIFAVVARIPIEAIPTAVHELEGLGARILFKKMSADYLYIVAERPPSLSPPEPRPPPATARVKVEK